MSATLEPQAAVPPPISMQRALGFVYAGYLFRYASLLVLIPFYGRVLGAAEYGRLLAAMSLFQLVWLLVDFGFPLAGVRDTAATTDRAKVATLYSRHLMGRLVLSGAGLAFGLAGMLLSPLLRENLLLGMLAVLNGLLAAYNLGWFFQGTQRFRTSVMLEAGGFILNVPLILWLVRGPGDAWVAMAVLLGTGLLCTAAAHVIALRSMDRRGLRWRGGFSLVRESTALFAHKGLTMMMASSSTYLLSLFASAAQVGWFGVAERLATVGLSLMQPANHVLVGTVSRRISAKASEASAYQLMRRSLWVMCGFGFALMVGTWLLAGTVVPLVLGPDFGPTVPMLYVLALLFPFTAFAQVTTGYVLIPLRHDAIVSGVSLLGAAITVLLIVALSQRYGGMGVAWARSGGQVALALALLGVLQHKQLLQRIRKA